MALVPGVVGKVKMEEVGGFAEKVSDWSFGFDSDRRGVCQDFKWTAHLTTNCRSHGILFAPIVAVALFTFTQLLSQLTFDKMMHRI